MAEAYDHDMTLNNQRRRHTEVHHCYAEAPFMMTSRLLLQTDLDKTNAATE